MMNNNWLAIGLLVFSSLACSNNIEREPAVASLQSNPTERISSVAQGPFAGTSASLNKYWYQGLAELNVYDLQQNRYQGVHPGQELVIFVSEDFLTDKQVKNDQYTNPTSTGILKTNRITRFTTGLYDYSIMNSIFTPVKTDKFPRTLKVSHSGQDWCGQVFQQVNFAADQYQMKLFSYFEREGDMEQSVAADFLEDEVLNRIRMLGKDIPTGTFEVVPALNYLRLRHQPQKAYQATATLSPYEGEEFEGEDLLAYQLEYSAIQRTVTFVFQSTSPYYIEGWTDTYASAFDKKQRTTVARRKSTELLPYWSLNEHNEKNAQLRQSLDWEK